MSRIVHTTVSHRFFILYYLALFPVGFCNAQSSLLSNQELIHSYRLVQELYLDSARQSLVKFRNEQPNQVLVHFVEDYADFIELFIQEDPNRFKNLKKFRKKRLSAIDKSHLERPWLLYMQAEIQLRWAILHIRFGEYLTAFTLAKSAYQNLEENALQYPDFIPTYKSLGILHAIVGSIPDQYQSLFTFFSGMRGTIAQGRKEMEIVLRYAQSQEDYVFKEETLFMYAMVLLHLENDADEAWHWVQSIQFEVKSPLTQFAISNIAMHSGHNQEALSKLSGYHPQPGQLEFPYLYFMYGLASLRNQQWNTAREAFSKYIQKHRGEHYLKEAYQKIAWSYLLDNDLLHYQYYMNQLKEVGSGSLDGDQQAHEESTSGSPPQPVLLSARLLFDGGYYSKAMSLLDQYTPLSLGLNEEQSIEFHYRQGRIYQAQGEIIKAINTFRYILKNYEASKTYFVANATLQLGVIHENQGNISKAKHYFEKCLDLKPNTYRTSIHMKAKSGLDRIKDN